MQPSSRKRSARRQISPAPRSGSRWPRPGPLNPSARQRRSLEAALAALGGDESAQRCRVLSHLGRALFNIGIAERARSVMREATDMARRLGDRRALLDALTCAQINSTGRPWPAARFPERRQTLGEMLAVAEGIGDPSLVMEAELRRLPAFLEMGDLAAFERSLANIRKLVERWQVAAELWATTSARAGGLPMAISRRPGAWPRRRSNWDAMHTARSLPASMACRCSPSAASKDGWRRWRQCSGDLSTSILRIGAWRPGLALIASDLGFDEAARKAFEDLADGGFTFPADAKWSLTISYLAEVCTRLRDRRRAGQLYQLLLPYRDVTIIAPTNTVCCGSAARYLGMLAGVIGDWTAAEAHFATALAMDEQMEAWPWLAHTQHEFAAALLARGRAGERSRAEAFLAARNRGAAGNAGAAEADRFAAGLNRRRETCRAF